MIEHQSLVDRSGGRPDNINRSTVLLGWTLVERTDSWTTIRQNSVRERFSVIAWPEVLWIVTIFYLSYFLFVLFWLKEILMLLLSCLSILVFLCTWEHYKALTGCWDLRVGGLWVLTWSHTLSLSWIWSVYFVGQVSGWKAITMTCVVVG